MSKEDAYKMMNLFNDIIIQLNIINDKLDKMNNEITEIKSRLDYVEQDIQ